MKALKTKQFGVFIVSAFFWLAIDLVSKAYATNSNLSSVIFIEDFFYLTHQRNAGIAFGLELPFMLQVFGSIGIILLLIYFGFNHLLKEKKNPFLNSFLLGIIIGGALGNLINRINLGYVIDFIVLKPIPVFNIADMGITLGIILLFLFNLDAINKKT